MAGNTNPSLFNASLPTDYIEELSDILISISLGTSNAPETPRRRTNTSISRENRFQRDATTLNERATPTPAQKHTQKLGGLAATRHSFFGDSNDPLLSLSLNDQSVKDMLRTAQSLDLVDEFGIIVILPPTFSKPPWDIRPYYPDHSVNTGSMDVVAYGPSVGVNPELLADTAFLIEVRDEEKLQGSIGGGARFVTLRQMLGELYERLYGSN